MRKKLAMTVSMIQMGAGPLGAAQTKEQMTASYEAYRKVVDETVSMVRDRTAQELAGNRSSGTVPELRLLLRIDRYIDPAGEL